MGNTLRQSKQYRQVVGMHSIYLVVKEFARMLQREILVFYCSFVSLKGHIFASIERFGSFSLVHMYEMWQMSHRLWLTQIYLNRWYIPDLIRLANDIETNQGPAVVDNIDSNKTICAPYSSSNILSSLSNRQLF